jgi:CheY-like chemotaxis protein
MRVLVVDPNLDAANRLRLVLRMQGHEVELAANAAAALDKARTSAPQLAFVDVTVAGYELARQLRDIPGCRRMVIVALTRFAARDADGEAAPPVEFQLKKPADPYSVMSIAQDVAARFSAS